MEGLEHQGVREDETSESERHQEHHEAHPGGDAEKARESPQDARTRASRGQHDVAGTRRDSGHDGEKEKGRGLLVRHNMTPWSWPALSGPCSRMRVMRLQQTRSSGEGLERS